MGKSVFLIKVWRVNIHGVGAGRVCVLSADRWCKGECAGPPTARHTANRARAGGQTARGLGSGPGGRAPCWCSLTQATQISLAVGQGPRMKGTCAPEAHHRGALGRAHKIRRTRRSYVHAWKAHGHARSFCATARGANFDSHFSKSGKPAGPIASVGRRGHTIPFWKAGAEPVDLRVGARRSVRDGGHTGAPRCSGRGVHGGGEEAPLLCSVPPARTLQS